MLAFSEDEMVLLETPEEIETEYEVKQYKYNGKKGSTLIGASKSYKIICREDSNTILVKNEEGISRVFLYLECVPLPYGETDILEMLPEVPADKLENESYF